MTVLLEQLHALNKHIYLLGDFNVHVNTLRTAKDIFFYFLFFLLKKKKKKKQLQSGQ